MGIFIYKEVTQMKKAKERIIFDKECAVVAGQCEFVRIHATQIVQALSEPGAGAFAQMEVRNRNDQCVRHGGAALRGALKAGFYGVLQVQHDRHQYA